MWTDGTLSLMTQGYAWLPGQMRTSADGTVRTRLLGRRTVALRGPEAVAFFYDEQHVQRRAALPDPVPAALRARQARKHREQALARLIVRVREQQEAAPDGSALDVVARHRDADGSVLDPHPAAVELLHIIRPTVAIAWYVTFAAHALHRWPEHRGPLRGDLSRHLATGYAHEVRRFYPSRGGGTTRTGSIRTATEGTRACASSSPRAAATRPRGTGARVRTSPSRC